MIEIWNCRHAEKQSLRQRNEKRSVLTQRREYAISEKPTRLLGFREGNGTYSHAMLGTQRRRPSRGQRVTLPLPAGVNKPPITVTLKTIDWGKTAERKTSGACILGRKEKWSKVNGTPKTTSWSKRRATG